MDAGRINDNGTTPHQKRSSYILQGWWPHDRQISWPNITHITQPPLVHFLAVVKGSANVSSRVARSEESQGTSCPGWSCSLSAQLLPEKTVPWPGFVAQKEAGERRHCRHCRRHCRADNRPPCRFLCNPDVVSSTHGKAVSPHLRRQDAMTHLRLQALRWEDGSSEESARENNVAASASRASLHG